MKNNLKRYWFPAVVVLLAALQSFAMEIHRSAGLAGMRGDTPSCFGAPRPDTVIYNNSSVYTKFRQDRVLEQETVDSLYSEDGTPLLTARDTIHAPDSLRETDPFRYRYYVELVDSLTHQQTRDSLRAAGDTIIWPKIDSIYYSDSALLAKKKFDAWYSSLDKTARKKYDYEQKMNRKLYLADSIYAAKDSIRAIRDSIRESTPRILETYAVPDSLFYKRIFKWNVGRDFNTISLREIDTTYNYWYNDYNFMRNDVNASYLGISGSPVQYYDVSKRVSEEGVSFYEPYESYSFSPATAPMYNTKTPYTELAYWGTLFANTEKEETNVHVLTTQNIYPGLNMTLSYDRTGANGMLESETVTNKNVYAGANWLGKKYAAHLGYIFNSIKKAENGGIIDSFWIRDTTVDSREVSVYLTDADNQIKKNTVFLNQEYRIPFNFLRNKGKEHSGDSTDVTTAFIGHNSEYSVYTKKYTDNISTSDEDGRNFYNNNFYINPTASSDSLRVMKFENKAFIRLQPWADDAIVSSVNAGIGSRIMSYYMATPLSYLTKPENTGWNSFYFYGGAAGQFKKYVSWDAQGHYTFAGDEANDFGISANARFSIYPFRKHRNSPMTFKAHFETSLDEPEYYQQHYYSNHLQWENDFDKISATKFEGTLEVPHWQFRTTVGFTQLNNNIYYDTQAIARQNTSGMSVFKVDVMKNFTLGKFHLDNHALFQYSSNEEVIPVPELALNLRWYLQFDVVKNVMQMQFGANTLYTTEWYAPSYSPQSGMFHNQTDEKYGDCPYIDVFVNIQWKRACIFVKLVNANMGWPMNSADYFSAAGYIRPQRSVKFGIWWPFYLQPNKRETASASGSSRSSSASRSN